MRIKPRAQTKSMFNGWALESKGVRRVRTPEGAKKYGQPIGSIIIAGGGVRGLHMSAMDASTGDGGSGKVLNNIKLEDSEFEGFDKVRTSKGRVLYIGKFPGEDEVTVNDEDDNELESFDTIEEAFAWTDKHGDEANFDDDEDTRAAKIAKNEPKAKAPAAPKKPSQGDTGGKKTPAKPKPQAEKGTVTGNNGKPIRAGDMVTHSNYGGNYRVEKVNDNGTISTRIAHEHPRNGWSVAPGQVTVTLPGSEFNSEGSFTDKFDGKRTSTQILSGDDVVDKDGVRYRVGYADPNTGRVSVKKYGKGNKPQGRWMNKHRDDLTVANEPGDDAPEAPEKPSGGESGGKTGGGMTDTGNTKKDFKPGDRVTSPITGKQYIVTGKPDRKGDIPVREINDDGSDNPDGTLRRIPARLLEPSTVSATPSPSEQRETFRNNFLSSDGNLATTDEGNALVREALEGKESSVSSANYRKFTTLPSEERVNIIDSLKRAEEEVGEHPTPGVASMKHTIKRHRERYESGHRVQSKNEADEAENGSGGLPVVGKFYRSASGLTLEVTEVNTDEGRVYGYPVDELGKRKTSRRMNGPLASFNSTWEEATDISGDRGVVGGPETPTQQRRKAAEANLKDNERLAKTAVDSNGDPIVISGGTTRYRLGNGNQQWTVINENSDGTVTIRGDRTWAATAGGGTQTRAVDPSTITRSKGAPTKEDEAAAYASLPYENAAPGDRVTIGNGKAVYTLDGYDSDGNLYGTSEKGRQRKITPEQFSTVRKADSGGSDLPGGTGTSTRQTLTYGDDGGDTDPDNPDADLDSAVRSGRMTARQARAEKDRRNRERAAARAREGGVQDTGMTPADFQAGDIVLANDGNRYRVIGTPRAGSPSQKIDVSETDNSGNAVGTTRRFDANTLRFENESQRRNPGAGTSDDDGSAGGAPTWRERAADREADDTLPGYADDADGASAGRYADKVVRNVGMIEMFREAMDDDSRTEENRRGLYEQMEHMRVQNGMYVRASQMDEDQGRLYMLSQGPPPGKAKPEELAVLKAYGSLIEMGAFDAAFVLLDETEKSGNGSYHIANTRNEVQKVITARETAAHGGVPRPRADDREWAGNLRTPVENRAFGTSAEGRRRAIEEDRWTPSQQRAYERGQKYRAALAEWEKLAEKSHNPITETKVSDDMGLQYKAVPVGGVKESTEQGVVTAIVAVTGLKDNVNDIILPGAFQKSLAKRTPKGVWHHNITDSVSRTEEIKELQPGDPELPETLPNGEPWPRTAGALRVKTRFNLGTSRGRDAYEDVKFFGTDQEWSIGYNVPTGGATIDRKTGVRNINTLDLYEYSPVLFGAMPNARTVSVKSAQETWATIGRLDSNDPYDMEIKSLFEDTIAEEMKGGMPPWLKDKVKKDKDDAENSSESQEDEDDDESSDDEGNGNPFAKRKSGKGKSGKGKPAFGGKRAAPFKKGGGRKSATFDPETIDRVDMAVKALAELRDYMVGEYKSDDGKKFSFEKDKDAPEPEEDEYDEDDEQTDDPENDADEAETDAPGEMATLMADAGLEDAADEAAAFDQAVASDDVDAVAEAANGILDAVEAAPADLADDDALKAVVTLVAQTLANDYAEAPTEAKGPAEEDENGDEKGKPPFPPKKPEEKSGGSLETKTIRVNPQDILDMIG